MTESDIEEAPDTVDVAQSTEPSELLSQLPDAPTVDPQDEEDVQQPSAKKQKTEETDDEFVMVEKDEVEEEKSKPEL